MRPGGAASACAFVGSCPIGRVFFIAVKGAEMERTFQIIRRAEAAAEAFMSRRGAAFPFSDGCVVLPVSVMCMCTSESRVLCIRRR